MTTTPTRTIALTGASNFRDLGGYVGAEGRALRWRTLFRSDHLAGLTAQDQAQLLDLGLAQVLDLRMEPERLAAPNRLPASVTQQALPITPWVLRQMHALHSTGHIPTPDDALALMRQTYRTFVTEEAATLATLFQRLLAAPGPLLFHCTAGKDRTGWVAAMLLLALGVPRAVVLEDYLLTNQLLQVDPAILQAGPPGVMPVLWRVQADYLEAGLDEIDTRWGGVDAYLSEALGLGPAERQQLAALYLQP